MPKDFEYWSDLFGRQELKEFSVDRSGLLWLKLKSIVRREHIDLFCQSNGIDLTGTGLGAQFKELYAILANQLDKSHTALNSFIVAQNAKGLHQLDTDSLTRELYKVDTFRWGADNQNDLGKYLVKKYIKDNSSYDFLVGQMESGILGIVHDYLVCSWYNHWSSILIEHLFKSHRAVLPTVGQVKSVDFFIEEIPFDLKVTYLPENFVVSERKSAGLRPEITVLKRAAREAKVSFENSDANLYYSLSERLRDKGGEAAKVVQDIREFRYGLVDRIKKEPLLLARNLYENQGDFRFGAENRVFLILIDRMDFSQSWKLKRNVDLLQPAIHEYLDSFKHKSPDDLKLEFYKEGDPNKHPYKYQVLTDVIVIEK